MRLFIVVISFMLLSSNAWAQDFTFTGVVKHTPNQANILIVNEQKYQINSQTKLNRIMKHNEFGPIFKDNQLIGFNISSSNHNELPLITEIWILDND